MAGTQQLPSWMTLSAVVITNAEGVPVSTSTTTLELPLTYYGPSIPLGTNGAWTWGGLYPPSSGPSSTATPTPVPSSFTATSTSFPSFRLSSSIVPINTSTSVSTPTVVASGAGSNLSKSALIGIIFGGIVGAIALFLLLACFIRWRVQRNRNGYRPTPIWTHWEVVSPSGPRSTNEDRHTGVGSPRGSGEEADSFLHHSQSGTQYRGSTVHPIASLPPGAAPPAFGTTSSGGSGHTSSSAVTDYGVLLPDGGRIGQAYAQEHDSYFLAARPSSEMAGHIIAPGELLRLDDEEEPQGPPRMYGVSSASDSDSLLPPFASLSLPPMSDGEKNSTRKTPSVTEKDKSLRSLSVPASDMEASEVFTARRVRVQDVGITSPGTDETSSHSHLEASLVAGPSGWRDSFRLSSIQRLRLSWFGSSSRNSRSSNSRSRSDDVESSQSLLQPPRRRHHSRLQLVITDDRPISTLSSKSAISGNTVYHDASSRLGTPVSVPSRAMTPATGGGAIPGGDVSPLPIGAPPAYALEDPYSSVSSRVRIPCSQAEDVLDLPVPAPASQFTASGGAGRGSAVVGLDGRSQSRTYCDSLSVITGSPNEVGITIDVLDAAPPVAGEGWRAMAGGFGSSRAQEGEERATSGTPQLIRQQQIMLSEQGSIHSMRSLLSPLSRSSVSGSAPGSRRSNGLSGSMSSGLSSRSRVHTTSSGSLRSESVSKVRGGASILPVSPAVSAFGPANEASSLSPPMADNPIFASSESDQYLGQSDNNGRNRVSVLGPMPSFTTRSVLAPTIRSVAATTTSYETEATRTTVTDVTNTTAFGGCDDTEPIDGSDDLVQRLRLGEFDIGRLRV